MEKAYEFLKNAGTYYLATVEGDQPRVRPFGALNPRRQKKIAAISLYIRKKVYICKS